MPRSLTAEQKAKKKIADAARYAHDREKAKAVARAWKDRNKERVTQYRKEYRETHAEEIATYNDLSKERQAEWRAEHKEEAVEYAKQYRIENKKVIAQKRREKYLLNIEAVKQRARELYPRHRERMSASSKTHRATRKDLHAAYGENKRIRRLNGEGKLMTEQGHKCPYCLGDLRVIGFNLDHYVPLARGGPHQDSNMQLTCPPCNSRKRAKHPADFLNEVIDLCELMEGF